MIALGTYIFLDCRGGTPPVLSFSGALDWKRKIFFGLAALGLFVCMHQGADAMLSWIPYSWGGVDEDGNFRSTRSGIAGMFSLLGGSGLIYLIDHAKATITLLDLTEEQLADERKVHAATSLVELQWLKSNFEKRAGELRAEIPETDVSSGEKLLRAVYGEVLEAYLREVKRRRMVACDELIEIIEKRMNSVLI